MFLTSINIGRNRNINQAILTVQQNKNKQWEENRKENQNEEMQT